MGKEAGDHDAGTARPVANSSGGEMLKVGPLPWSFARKDCCHPAVGVVEVLGGALLVVKRGVEMPISPMTRSILSALLAAVVLKNSVKRETHRTMVGLGDPGGTWIWPTCLPCSP